MLASVLIAAVSLAAVPAPASTSADAIPAVAVASGRLDTLVAAVTAAGLAEAISGEGPFTVFAPTDEAFSRIPKETLAGLLEPRNRDTLVRILKHHVVPGRLKAADLVGLESVETLAGTTLELGGLRGRLLVADAVVETADVSASNGVVHLIDRVLMPPAQVPPLMTLLENAVDRGAPIFNDGNPAACAAVYATALEAAVLVEDFGIDANARRRIATRLAEIESMSDAREQAWAYRRIIDSLVAAVQQGQIAMKPTSAAVPVSANKASAGRMIFAFDDAGEVRRWFTVLDGVMGGLSTGRIAAGSGTLVFDGATSLENNGGFSSMRVDLADGLFDGYDAVKLRVKGDGREYRLGAKSGRGAGAGGYWAPFATEKDRWIEVIVPIADLDRHFMGQQLPGRLDPADLRSLEFYIYDKKAGPFRLEIDTIEAVRMKDQSFDA
ncbi:MAG: CIA30 family protein [Phycisphaerales bacterium]